MYLIAGLGNPGRPYRWTRHNVGFMLLDLLAERGGKKFDTFVGSSLICRVRLADTEVLLAKPQTYMNRSGQALRELLQRFSLETSSCLVVYDEIALPLGKIRLRASGSAGGHKGMQSIVDCLGTEDLQRLRIGISSGQEVEDLSDFVLSRFRRRERVFLKEILEMSKSAISMVITDGIERAMAQYN